MTQRSKFDLSFYHEDDGVWHVDLSDWPFAHHNLAMVGAPTSYAAILRMAD